MPFRKIFQQINQHLGVSVDETTDDSDSLELAVACLLIEMCEADSQTDEIELETVANSLKNQFKLDPDIVAELIDQARHRNNKEVSFHPYVNIVNELATIDEKTEILRQMWRVAYADNELDKYEEHYLRRLADLLNLPHRIFIQTKHQVIDNQ